MLTIIRPTGIFLLALAALFLLGCGSSAHKNSGGYYLNDGPGKSPPVNLHQIPDAIPKAEPLRKANMRPYVALGKKYTPMTKLTPYKKQGIASWYGRRYHGNKTASGEVYDMYAMTAAHPTLPLPSYARITNVDNGKSVVVRINDRGPFLNNRLIDLSYTAAYKLGIIKSGHGEVIVESILPNTGATHNAQIKTQAIQPKLEATSSNKIFLQLGAFNTAANAYRYLSQLQQELPWLSQTIKASKTNGLYKIQTGPYPNLPTAQQTADTIHQQLAINPIVLIK